MAKSIVVSMSDFTVTAFEDGNQVHFFDQCGFGRHDGDPKNLTPAMRDNRLSWFRKADHVVDDPDSVSFGAKMNNALFIAKQGGDEPSNYAFHEGNTLVESHGCIHLTNDDSNTLFRWAADHPVAVTIEGPHPEPGVREYKLDSRTMLPRVVLAINQRLAAAVGLAKEPDQIYDETTREAVRAFQAAKNSPEEPVAADGVVGPQTAALFELTV
jgi:hypothetical protein